MLSLYRAGRQTEALAAYQSHRRRLSSELGLEPSSQLRALERRILEHDSSLGAHRASRSFAPPPWLKRRRIVAAALALAAVTASVIAGVKLGTGGSGASQTTATVTLRAQDGVHSATAIGHGPFNALHLCLRKCLSKLYPQITEVRLTDYKVRVLDSHKGTAANVRVLIEWADHRKSWSTVGVSDNVIEASWNALVDAIRLELMRLTEQDDSVERAVEDYCWGV